MVRTKASKSEVVSVDGITESFGRCVGLVEGGGVKRLSRTLDFGQGPRSVLIYPVDGKDYKCIRIDVKRSLV